MFFDEINSSRYLKLAHLSEPDENSLELMIEQAGVGERTKDDEVSLEVDPTIHELLLKSRRIEPVAGCKRFRVHWETYISYSVINESFEEREPERFAGIGRLFVVYEDSLFLRYTKETTFASSDYPGPFKQWTFYCLGHSVNVVSANEPAIELEGIV